MHVKKEDFAASNQEEHLKVFLDFNILVKKSALVTHDNKNNSSAQIVRIIFTKL